MESSDQTAARVVLVEDSEEIADIVATALRFDGHEVFVEGTGRGGLERVARERPDLVLLDVMLPDTDGFAVQRQLLAADHPSPPVVFLTARDDSVDVVRALDLGADDYIRKPFQLDELLARVRAALRRAQRSDPRPRQDQPLRIADLELDPLTRDVRRAGQLVSLTPREFELLAYLLRNAGIVLTKGQILDEVWKYDFGGDAGVVETYVGYLRRKIDGSEPKLLHTVRGVGYCLRERPAGA